MGWFGGLPPGLAEVAESEPVLQLLGVRSELGSFCTVGCGGVEEAEFGAKGTAVADAGKDDVFDGGALVGGDRLVVVKVLGELGVEAGFGFEAVEEGEAGGAGFALFFVWTWSEDSFYKERFWRSPRSL